MIKDKGSVGLFLLSFSATFFVVSVLFLFLTVTVHPKAPPDLMADGEVEDEYTAHHEDALTVLVMGTSSSEAVAGIYLLVRFDPIKERVYVAALPPQTELVGGDKLETLADSYRYGGARYTVSALERHLDLPIDRYLRVTRSGFITAMSAVGAVEFELDDDITFIDGDAPITLSRGAHLLDGRKLAGVVSGQNIALEDRADLVAAIAAAAINQRIDVAKSTLLDKIFETVINLVDTDISYGDFEQRKMAAAHMASVAEPAHIIKLDGVWEDGFFRLSDTALAALARLFL